MSEVLFVLVGIASLASLGVAVWLLVCSPSDDDDDFHLWGV